MTDHLRRGVTRTLVVVVLLLVGCIRYTPPAMRYEFNTRIYTADHEGTFRTLVAMVNSAGFPIQFTDSGAGLLRIGPLDLRGHADCGTVRADIDNIKLSNPIGTITFVLQKRDEYQELSASSQIAQTLYQMNRGLYWQPTNVLQCSSTHVLEEGIAAELRKRLGLK